MLNWRRILRFVAAVVAFGACFGSVAGGVVAVADLAFDLQLEKWLFETPRGQLVCLAITVACFLVFLKVLFPQILQHLWFFPFYKDVHEDHSCTDESRTESLAPPTRHTGVGLVVAALILPVIAGTVLFFVTSFGLALGISAATVIASAALVAIDARRLGNVDLTGRVRESAGLLFVGMILLWIVVYPLAFFRRRHFGGPNLAIPAVIVAVFLGLGPLLYSVLIPPGLPSCTSPEVVQLLDQLIRGRAEVASAKSIDGHHELSYDRDADVRHGQCVVHTDGGDIDVKYLVEWADRDKGQFAVRIFPAVLPSCASPEVVQLLERLIRRASAGASAKSIDGHREVSYDRDADVRHGQCVVHTDAGDIDVKYLVEWLDHDQGQFAVRIPPTDLPSCTSPEVVQVLEQVIRGTPAGMSVKSIDGHRELSYDRDADVRHGQCVVHTDTGDVNVKYLVEWRDRDQGQFVVRTFAD